VAKKQNKSTSTDTKANKPKSTAPRSAISARSESRSAEAKAATPPTVEEQVRQLMAEAKWGDALKIGQAHHEANPDDFVMRILITISLRQAGRVAEALAEATQLTMDNPNSVHAWAERGECELIEKRYLDAIGSFEKAMRIATATPQIRAGYADALLRVGYVERGKSEMALALAEAPANAQRFFRQRFAQALATAGQLEEAIPLFEEMLPTAINGGAYIGLAQILIRLGRKKEAADHLHAALAKGFDSDVLREHLALATVD